MLIASMLSLALIACEKDPHNSNNGNNSENEEPILEIINDAVTDVDGNHYNAVRIGNQVWMSENLKTRHFADGTAITVVDVPNGQADPGTVDYASALSSPHLYIVGNSTSHFYYNWSAAMHGASSSNSNPSGVQGVCPNGWHMPSEAEWQELKDYCSSFIQLQCDSCEYCIGKALAAADGWQNASGCPCCVGNNQGSNNATGFSAMPIGFTTVNPNGEVFTVFGNRDAVIWSTTRDDQGLIIMGANFSASGFYRMTESGLGEKSGCPVRCVRN